MCFFCTKTETWQYCYFHHDVYSLNAKLSEAADSNVFTVNRHDDEINHVSHNSHITSWSTMKCVPWKTVQEKHTYTSVSNPFYKCTYLPCSWRPTHAAVLHQHHSFRVVLQPTASGGNIWPFCSWVLYCVHQLVTICFCDFRFCWKQLPDKKWWMMELKQSRKAVSETLNSAESYAKLSPLSVLCCTTPWNHRPCVVSVLGWTTTNSTMLNVTDWLTDHVSTTGQPNTWEG